MQLLIGEILDRATHTVPGKTAVTLGDTELTFADIDDRSNRLANALRGIGIGRKDIVVWWSDMALRTIDGFMALQRLGAAFAPINPRFSGPEAIPVLEYLHPRLLVSDRAHADVAAEISRSLGIELAVFGASGGTVPGHDLDSLASSAAPALAGGDGPEEQDPHAIFLTSGSTGVPKGVVLSHRTSWLRGAWMADPPVLPEGRVPEQVCMFPMFHWAGWSNLIGTWQAQATVHLVQRAEPEEILRAVEKHRVSTLYCIPGVWRRILSDPTLDFDLSSLRHVNTGTSAATLELLSELKERFPGTTTGIGYGSTEGGGATHLYDADLFRKPGSVGKPNRFIQIKLTDDGEICVHSTALMTGYLDRPADTAEVLVDDWYHMGDLGAFDDEGYLWLTGRKREIIRSGGETIAPVEVEEAMRNIPGVKDVAVVGIPDESWGEIVSAVFVLDEGASGPTVEDVRSYLVGLAPHKHPRQVYTLDAIPRTPATGQVRRALLRDLLVSGDSSPALSAEGSDDGL